MEQCWLMTSCSLCACMSVSISYTFLITSRDTWTRDRGLRDVKFLWLSRKDSVGIDQRKGWSELTVWVKAQPQHTIVKSRVCWFYWTHRTKTSIRLDRGWLYKAAAIPVIFSALETKYFSSLIMGKQENKVINYNILCLCRHILSCPIKYMKKMPQR